MELKVLLLSALAVAATFSVMYMTSGSEKVEVSDQFTQFTKEHGKRYSSPQEAEYRLSVFKQTLKVIKETNARQSDFVTGVNQFSDMTFEEFKKFYLMEPLYNDMSDQTEWKLQAGKKDWSAEGKVSPVKDQGLCGSAWAFSATGALESALAIRDSSGDVYTSEVYSEQELIDCSSTYGNNGCHNGLMTKSFNYISKERIGTEEEYPYKGREMTCSRRESEKRVGIHDHRLLASQDVPTLIGEIRNAPVSVLLEVQEDFMSYRSGVYKNSNCGTRLNHAALVVGYNSEEGEGYFIVKNCWGADWGMEGYIRMAFGTGKGTCGIANPWDAMPIL